MILVGSRDNHANLKKHVRYGRTRVCSLQFIQVAIIIGWVGWLCVLCCYPLVPRGTWAEREGESYTSCPSEPLFLPNLLSHPTLVILRQHHDPTYSLVCLSICLVSYMFLRTTIINDDDNTIPICHCGFSKIPKTVQLCSSLSIESTNPLQSSSRAGWAPGRENTIDPSSH